MHQIFKIVKIPKFRSYRFSKFQNFKIPRFQNVKIARFPNSKVSKFPSFEVSTIQNVWRTLALVVSRFEILRFWTFQNRFGESDLIFPVFLKNTSAWNKGANVQQIAKIRKKLKMPLTSRKSKYYNCYPISGWSKLSFVFFVISFFVSLGTCLWRTSALRY